MIPSHEAGKPGFVFFIQIQIRMTGMQIKNHSIIR